MSFRGKRGLVTGGGSGIGAATAELLVSSGAEVVVAGRREKPLLALVEKLDSLQGRIDHFVCDITDGAQVEELVEMTASDQGIDFVVNSAGIYVKSLLVDMEEKYWDETFDANVKGIYLVLHRAIPHMRDGSSIVNIASTLAYQTSPGTGAYGASKAAVVALSRSLARELAPRKVRVNCVCPGIVDTPVHDRYVKSGEERARFLEEVGRMVPLGRIGEAEDVARAVLFLLSEEAAWITGAVIPVDGGISLV